MPLRRQPADGQCGMRALARLPPVCRANSTSVLHACTHSPTRSHWLPCNSPLLPPTHVPRCVLPYYRGLVTGGAVPAARYQRRVNRRRVLGAHYRGCVGRGVPSHHLVVALSCRCPTASGSSSHHTPRSCRRPPLPRAPIQMAAMKNSTSTALPAGCEMVKKVFEASPGRMVQAALDAK